MRTLGRGRAPMWTTAVLAAVVLSGCVTTFSDQTGESITIEGAIYDGRFTEGLDIGPDDLTAIGTPTITDPISASGDVYYSLAGVDPSVAVIMPAGPGLPSPYMVFARRDLNTRLEFSKIPGLCDYATEAARDAGSCP